MVEKMRGKGSIVTGNEDCWRLILLVHKRIYIKKGRSVRLTSELFPTSEKEITRLENVKDVEHGVRVRRTINNGGGGGSSSNDKLRQRRKGGQLVRHHTRERRVDHSLRVKASVRAHGARRLGRGRARRVSPG